MLELFIIGVGVYWSMPVTYWFVAFVCLVVSR
jgi:hypothetical protein